MPIANLRGKLLLALVSGVFTLGLLGLTGEWLVRYRELHRDTVPGTMPLLFYRHAQLGHALVRNYTYFGRAHVDGQGFRGPEVSLAKAPGVIRVMVVGGSTTFDTFVSGDDRAWPARLAVHLQELEPGRKVEVINAGVPGYVVLHDIIRLATDYWRYSPDLIVLYQGHNDLFADLHPASAVPSPSTPGEVPPITPWMYWLDRHSLLYTKLAERLGAIRFRSTGAAAPPPPAGLLDTAAAAFSKDVGAFLAMARSMNIPVLVPEVVEVSAAGATHEADSTIRAEWAASVPFAPTDLVLQGYVRFNHELQSAAQREGAQYIPTDQFGLAGTQWYAPSDPIHFNDAGADRMAAGVAQAMVSSGILDRLASPLAP